jgi:predicted Zn finger-like uncharacterized protein
MIEIQCTSCHTRYRIDQRVLPDDTPTFKCSRCGHVFNADPVPAKVGRPAPPEAENESQPPRTIRPARPRPSALKSPVESDVVKRAEARGQRAASEKPRAPVEQETPAPPDPPENRDEKVAQEPEADDPLNRTFGDREQKADTGENLRFDFSDERGEAGHAPADDELERPDPHDGGWQVGDLPDEFASAPIRQAPTMMADPEPPPRLEPAPVRRMASPLEAEAPRFAQPPGHGKSTGFQLGQADDSGDVAPSGTTHASGVFLAMFFFVAIAFLAASALICDEPVASARILGATPRIGAYFARPIVPAMLVTLHDVRSEYYTLKGGHVALVITGHARNVGDRPLHLVGIDADLIGDTVRPLASQSVYCGNELSAQMLAEMTPREIEFSQGLSPQKAFAMEPSASAPFLMVFIDPPTGAGKIRISVSKAEAGAIADPPA